MIYYFVQIQRDRGTTRYRKSEMGQGAPSEISGGKVRDGGHRDWGA